MHIDQNITTSAETSNFVNDYWWQKTHCLAVTNLSALLRGNSPNHHEDFYCLNCFNSYTTKNKLKEHEEICNNHDNCHIEMPKWFEKY